MGKQIRLGYSQAFLGRRSRVVSKAGKEVLAERRKLEREAMAKPTLYLVGVLRAKRYDKSKRLYFRLQLPTGEVVEVSKSGKEGLYYYFFLKLNDRIGCELWQGKGCYRLKALYMLSLGEAEQIERQDNAELQYLEWVSEVFE